MNIIFFMSLDRILVPELDFKIFEKEYPSGYKEAIEGLEGLEGSEGFSVALENVFFYIPMKSLELTFVSKKLHEIYCETEESSNHVFLERLAKKAADSLGWKGWKILSDKIFVLLLERPSEDLDKK